MKKILIWVVVCVLAFSFGIVLGKANFSNNKAEIARIEIERFESQIEMRNLIKDVMRLSSKQSRELTMFIKDHVTSCPFNPPCSVHRKLIRGRIK